MMVSVAIFDFYLKYVREKSGFYPKFRSVDVVFDTKLVKVSWHFSLQPIPGTQHFSKLNDYLSELREPRTE